MSRRPAPPLPLGFLALAAGRLLLATLNLGWLEPADGREVAISPSASPAWERAAGWIGVAPAALATFVAAVLGLGAALRDRRAA